MHLLFAFDSNDPRYYLVPSHFILLGLSFFIYRMNLFQLQRPAGGSGCYFYTLSLKVILIRRLLEKLKYSTSVSCNSHFSVHTEKFKDGKWVKVI